MTQKQWDEHVAKGKLPIGTPYWVADLLQLELIYGITWGEHAVDKRLLGRGILFRTKAQALACAKRMIAAAKEGE